uniref:Unknown product n=1 Tax=Potato virus X TaxID=12183 RepID=Q85246_PVX|nr:unknown product [Potato virus X]ACX48434.1 p25 [Potato virus X]
MDILISSLKSLGYSRTSKSLDSGPLVVHAVAGAGKSTALRKLILRHPTFTVHTLGVPDKVSIRTRGIQKPGPIPEGNFAILDEYTLDNTTRNSNQALFADPYQAPEFSLEPHFYLETSFRVPRKVADLIAGCGFDFETNSPEEGHLEITGIFKGPLLGKVIAIDEESETTLSRHGVEFVKPCQVTGLEFKVVTIVSAAPIEEIGQSTAFYNAITRSKGLTYVRAGP